MDYKNPGSHRLSKGETVVLPQVQQLALINANGSTRPKTPSRPAINADVTGSFHRDALFALYADVLQVNSRIDRSLISFQANKRTPFYRWLKYKEAFSSEFVQFILEMFRPDDVDQPVILDPFAGAGTTLTTAAHDGWRATGIELMSVGPAALRARLLAVKVDLAKFRHHLTLLENLDFSTAPTSEYKFSHIRITEDAFPAETEGAFGVYDAFLETIPDLDIRALFRFAWLAILEDISYTRKDGQYLRWDHRSKRTRPSKFNKGPIHRFKSAIVAKLYSMMEDISHAAHTLADVDQDAITLCEGSSLSVLPTLPSNSVDLALTSPPYCNRYDYTRTYALELAFAGKTERQVKQLRQTLLSATVENKTKREQLAAEYRKRGDTARFAQIARVFDEQVALQEVLGLLHAAKAERSLNNSNIPGMIEYYFFEMNVIIAELARILKPGGHVVMVNDNVQYHGEEVPVDLILSDFAVQAGLVVDKIWVLPRGKGNSSQQMGAHGRNEIRKCVYVWSKPHTATP